MPESLINYGVTDRAREGGVKSNLVEIAIEGVDIKGLCVQQLQANVSKQTQTVYEVGSENFYIIDGRPSGTGSMQNLIGPNSKYLNEIYSTLGDVCNDHALTMNVKPGCLNSKGGSMRFAGMALTSIGMTATSQTYAITGQLGFSFVDVTRL